MNRVGSGNAWGLGLVILGAAALTIATFLPFNETISIFGRIQHNTLIQHDGWYLIALALAIAGTGYRAFQHNQAEWVVPLILSIIGALIVLALGNSDDMRRLYPDGPNGVTDTSAPGVLAPLGVAIYVAGAGVAAAFIGSLALRRGVQHDKPDSFVERAMAERPTRQCPDCAEVILADAKVCRHCGYRFIPVEPTSNVCCWKCNHLQPVPISQEGFRCEKCNTLTYR